MAAIYAKRKPFVAKYLAEHEWCEVRLPVCLGRSVDVHEVIRRSHGGALYPGQPGKRPTDYVAVCRACHTHITEHPAWARANGWELR